MRGDLTQGPVTRTILCFAVPMILGNLLQQCYNVADTLIVGQFLGPNPLAAVGAAYTLMTFLTSILLGLCMGSGAVFSILFGQNDMDGMKESMCASFLLIALLTAALTAASFLGLEWFLRFQQVPTEVAGYMRAYLAVIFWGIPATFLYNYFASLLRAVGNSVVPLLFLAVSAVMNIGLDLWFVVGLGRGVAGAAEATVIAQYASGAGIALYTWLSAGQLRPEKKHCRLRWMRVREIGSFSALTCLQQSVMNLGILMVQGLVNSFGPTVMAAFAAAVKIDSFAYMPVQDFGNAFSTFVAQNYGARKKERIQSALRGAVAAAAVFCLVISAGVWVLARPLMLLFISPEETGILAEGIRYLRIEGAFYCGIGCLFLLYGLYRALGRPGMSVVLTVISLGTRVALAYLLSAVPAFGVAGIWWSVPIGWALADAAGLLYYRLRQERLFSWRQAGEEGQTPPVFPQADR